MDVWQADSPAKWEQRLQQQISRADNVHWTHTRQRPAPPTCFLRNRIASHACTIQLHNYTTGIPCSKGRSQEHSQEKAKLRLDNTSHVTWTFLVAAQKPACLRSRATSTGKCWWSKWAAPDTTRAEIISSRVTNPWLVTGQRECDSHEGFGRVKAGEEEGAFGLSFDCRSMTNIMMTCTPQKMASWNKATQAPFFSFLRVIMK